MVRNKILSLICKCVCFEQQNLVLNRYKDDQKLSRASSKHRTFEEFGVHTILFPSAIERDSGKYTCSAINEYGRIHASSYVRIIHPSSIPRGKPAMFLSRPDKVLSLVEGEDIVVSFRVTGDPKPRGKMSYRAPKEI